MRRITVVAGLVAFVALTGSAGATGAARTKADFIRQGDALCARTVRELVPLRRRAEAAQHLPEYEMWAAVASIWSEQIRIQIRFNRQLRLIGTPPNDATARALLARLDHGVVLARRVRDAFANASVNVLASAAPAYLRFTLALNRQIKAYGFRVCGR
jgi:hypothetical protein